MRNDTRLSPHIVFQSRGVYFSLTYYITPSSALYAHMFSLPFIEVCHVRSPHTGTSRCVRGTATRVSGSLRWVKWRLWKLTTTTTSGTTLWPEVRGQIMAQSPFVLCILQCIQWMLEIVGVNLSGYVYSTLASAPCKLCDHPGLRQLRESLWKCM